MPIVCVLRYMHFWLPRCLVSRAAFLSSLVRGKSSPRGVQEWVAVAAGGGVVCGTRICSTPPAPPLLCTQVPRTVETADGLGWMRWNPTCPSPHCPFSQGGWEGVVVHCSLDPPPLSSWRELRSWLPWRQRRGKRGCRETLRLG